MYHDTILNEQVELVYAYIVLQDGGTKPNFTIAAVGRPYRPQQMVMHMGVKGTAYWTGGPEVESAQSPTLVNWEGHTNTSRKLKVGDELYVVAQTAANACQFNGVATFFLKG